MNKEFGLGRVLPFLGSTLICSIYSESLKYDGHCFYPAFYEIYLATLIVSVFLYASVLVYIRTKWLCISIFFYRKWISKHYSAFEGPSTAVP